MDGDKPKRQRFKRYPIGFFHIDIAEVQTVEGKLSPFVAIHCLAGHRRCPRRDRTARFAVTQLVEKADRRTAWAFLEHVLKSVPYRIHTILTDRAVGTPLVRETMARGIQFAEQPRNRNTVYSRPMRFDMICDGGTMSAIGPRTMVERDRAQTDETQPPVE